MMMNEMLTYLVETAICSGVLYAVYAALLERRTPFRWCRAYLLATVCLAGVIPALRIPVWPAPVVAEVLPVVPVDFSDTAAATVVEAAVDWGAVVFWAVYCIGTAVVLVPVLRQLLLLRRIRRTGQIAFADDYTLVRTPERIEACSLFRTIYVWQGTPDDEIPVILLHERSHIRHRHSAERIAMETMKALLWWNPFVWLAASRLNEVEEYEADGDVLRSGCDVRYYMQLILKQLLGYSPDITNGLRNSRTKKRFIMMTTDNAHRHVLLRLAGTVPALIGLLCAFSFTSRAAEPVVSEHGTSLVGTAQQPDDAYFRVEVMPTFRGGNLNDFRRWVQTQVRMPEEALDNRIQGRVVATFTIEKDGTLANIEILQTPDRSLSEEVERVLKRSDKWTPGMQKGEAVRVKYTLPVDFRLAGVESPAEQDAAPVPSENTAEELVVVAYPKAEAPAEKTVTVHAFVTNEGKPLAGALVQEVGSTNGAVTDADGRATIKTAAGRTLTVSHVGCMTYSYTVGEPEGQAFIISLVSSEQSADGTVTVSGYGTRPNDEKPMLIVDDQPVEGGVDRLNEIDVNDIQNLSILKGNGENAIVVTTKSGAAKKQAAN
ncbi:MAG: TonB family protein [Alistipes sp.]|nr:TonB family protein [Alistipes sp.]